MDIVVTGMGVVSPLGRTREDFVRAWADGRVGLGELTLCPPENGCEHAAEVHDYDWRNSLLTKQTFADRATQLAIGAVRGAIEDAGWTVPYTLDLDNGGAARTQAPLGLCLGTAYGCAEAAEKFFAPVAAGKGRAASGLVFSHSYPNGPAAAAAIEFGLRGHGAVHAGAREAGWWALRSAADALALGEAAGITRLVVGAVDAISPAVVGHLAASGQSPDTVGATFPTRADDADPAAAAFWGRVPGEGAVFFMMETAASARERGALVLAAWNEAEAAAVLAHRPADSGAWRLGDAGAVSGLYSLAAFWLD